jgi:hypothetical protein
MRPQNDADRPLHNAEFSRDFFLCFARLAQFDGSVDQTLINPRLARR